MIQNVYVIYDSLAQEAGPIFAAKNDLVALRASGKLIGESDEYTVYCIGEYDNEELKLTSLEKREVKA
jgi:hypothetical protein